MARAAAIETARIAFAPSLLFGGDNLVDVVYRLEHAFARVAALIAVAQLQGFVLTGGSSAGDGGAATGSAG
jgi:hypothetical protein